MPLTVLSDADVVSILNNLTREDMILLQDNLGEAMHDYSTGTQETTQACAKNQPKRMAVPAENNRTTLFMPAVTNTSRGIKIVSLPTAPMPSHGSSLASLSLNDSPKSRSRTSSPSRHQSPSRSSTMSSHDSTSISSAPSGGASSNNTPSTGASSLYHTSSGTSTSSTDFSALKTLPRHSPYGSLTLLTPSGMPYAFLGTEELTAFRTALSSTRILLKRDRVHSITVFGAGAQARWHIRLALMLRANEVHHIDIINRSFARAKKIMHDFHTAPEWTALREANPKVQFSILSSEYKEYQLHLKEHVRKADVIFLCTPSTEPLFPHEYLTNPEGRRKGRYISAIGSYRPYMCELHPEILKQAVASEHKHHHHRHAHEGGVVVVDSLEASMREAGEIIQAGLNPEQLVEVGELLMIKKAAMREVELGTGEGEKGLRDWIMRGNLLYKSVGLGLMDICVGEDLVQIARNKGIGTQIDGF